eukprot:TRINITY_DN12781_c0_g1_i1.p1 TRINITY_DN12781_c0_g1~~TRINITY_DN12781_c0_g1_i1.p1  ORF type:complete len:479 (+),score=66.88 TRINITY_DN12781_c0_g1_i1:101-1537(+)
MFIRDSINAEYGEASRFAMASRRLGTPTALSTNTGDLGASEPSPAIRMRPQVPKISFLESHQRRVRSASGVRRPARVKAGERTVHLYGYSTAQPLSARLPVLQHKPREKAVSDWPTEVSGNTLTIDLSQMTKGTSAASMIAQQNHMKEEGPFPEWYTPRPHELAKSLPKPSSTRRPVLSDDTHTKPRRLPVPPQVDTPKREDPSQRCTHDSEMQRERPCFVTRKQLSDCKMLASANRRAGKIRFEGISYYKMGVLHDNLKEHRKAIVQYKKFLAICKRTNDTVGEALAYNCIAVDYHTLGGEDNLSRAIEFHQKHRDIADIPGKFTCYSNLGLAYQQMGDLDQAVHNHQNALRHAIHMSSLEGTLLHTVPSLWQTQERVWPVPIWDSLERRMERSPRLAPVQKDTCSWPHRWGIRGLRWRHSNNLETCRLLLGSSIPRGASLIRPWRSHRQTPLVLPKPRLLGVRLGSPRGMNCSMSI